FDGLECVLSASPPGGVRSRIRRLVRSLGEVPGGVLRMRQGGEFMASYRAEWRHFLEAVRGDASVECTLEDGRRALQVVLAAMESASSGQPVRVARLPERGTVVA